MASSFQRVLTIWLTYVLCIIHCSTYVLSVGSYIVVYLLCIHCCLSELARLLFLYYTVLLCDCLCRLIAKIELMRIHDTFV